MSEAIQPIPTSCWRAGLLRRLCLLAMTGALSTIIPLAAHAATSGTPEPKYDTKQPIEISSDTLEVQQHLNKAIFKGNVVAVQGTIRMKSDIMNVYYQQKKQDGPKPAPTPAGSGSATPPGAMGAITRIEVEGHVFVATPEETATGDTGNYEVATKLLHLFGKKVTLTREKNVLVGTALEYNMETGRSLLTNEGGGVTSTGVGTSDGRVHGLFVPEDQPKEPKQPTPQAQPQPAPAQTYQQPAQ